VVAGDVPVVNRSVLKLAVRLDTSPPSSQDMAVRTTTGKPAEYGLLSLPLYMVESLPTAVQAS
jgi:hypothetical protein